MATILDSSTPVFCLGCQSSTHQGGGKVGDLTVRGVNFHLHFLFAVRLSICPQLFRVQSPSLWTSLNLQSLEAVGVGGTVIWLHEVRDRIWGSWCHSQCLPTSPPIFPAFWGAWNSAGFFQDSLGENSFCGSLCCRFKFQLFLGFKVSCNLPFSS